MSDFPIRNTLNSMPVLEDKALVGAKKAYILDGVIYVSPAMMDLIQHSDDELDKLLASIPAVDLGYLPPLTFHQT